VNTSRAFSTSTVSFAWVLATLLAAAPVAAASSASRFAESAAPAPAAHAPFSGFNDLPGRFSWLGPDTRAVSYALGTSMIVGGGVHLLIGLPAAAIYFGAFTNVLDSSLTASLAMTFGFGMTYLVLESLVAATAATLIFNNSARAHDARFGPVFAAHVVGQMVGLLPVALMFGSGHTAWAAAVKLIAFTGGNGLGALAGTSLLAVVPAFLLSGLSMLLVPALAGAVAVAATAAVRPGFAVDPHWQQGGAVGVEPLAVVPASPTVATIPVWSLAVPGT
jgi:hypothetical protein